MYHETFHRENLLGQLTVAVETSSAAQTVAYVRSGVGVGLTAGYLRGFLGRGLGIRSLGAWFGAARYVFVRPRGAYLPPAQGDLAEMIRSAVRRLPPNGVR